MMKRNSLWHLLQTGGLMLLLWLAMPSAIWAQTYISELALAGHSDNGDNAKQQLRNAGYTVIDKDLNADAGGWYVYLGYKTSTKYEEAITDLLVQDGNRYFREDSPDVGGKKWSRVRTLNGFNGDLNCGAGGADLTLFYTKADTENHGNALTGLWTSNSSSGASVWRFGGLDCYAPCDLNRGAGGEDIYLIRGYTAAPPQLDLCDDISNTADFSNVLTYTPDKPYISYYKRLYTYKDADVCDLKVTLKNQGTTTTIFEKKNYSEVQHAQNKKTWSDTQTSYNVPGIGTVLFKHGYYQRVTNMQTGDTELWEEHRIYLSKMPSDGSITITQTHGGSSVSVTRKIACNYDNVNIIDPFINMQADTTDVGQQILYVSSTFDIHRVEVYKNNGSFSFAKDFSQMIPLCSGGEFQNPKMPDIKLPATDTICQCVAVIYTKPLAEKSKDENLFQHCFPIQFEYKGFHTINDFTVTQMANPDTTGVRDPYNRLMWYTTKVQDKNSNDEDVLSSDEFVILRSEYEDFRVYQTLGSLGLDESSSSLSTDTRRVYVYNDVMEGCEIGLSDKEKTTNVLHHADSYVDFIGHWTGLIISPSAFSELNNLWGLVSPLKIPQRKLYYCVVRASVGSVWPTVKEGFTATGSTVLRSALPSVSEVTVTKGVSYASDKMVRIRVRLNNPFPWAIKGNSFRPNDTDFKHKLALQGDSCRLFMWDEKARIKVHRTGVNGQDGSVENDAEKNLVIEGTDVHFTTEDGGYYYADIEDVHEYPYTRYAYEATVDTQRSDYDVCQNTALKTDAKDCYSETAGVVRNFMATRGTEDGYVKVSWEISEGLSDGCELWRVESGSTDSTRMVLENEHDMTFIDYNVVPGKAYEYHLQAKFHWKDNRSTMYHQTWGYASHYGTIAGRILLGDGSPYPGQVVVETKSQADIHIAEAYYKGERLNPVINQEKNTIIKAEVDSLGYYNVRVLLDPSHSTTTYAMHVNGFPDVSAVLSRGLEANVRDKNLICPENYTIEGRVLFESSTVPVTGAKFRFNGRTIMGRNNQPITTDNRGNFIFTVPGGIEATMQVWKEDHTMHQGGYIKGGDSGEETTFVVSQNYKGKLLQDDTRVRLVGRLIGGNKQGTLPVGFGQTKNNLGDDLCVVLQLEGDNTSQIVYDNDTPDQTTRKETFKQQVSVSGDTYLCNETAVSFEKKRIVITPNVTTGEFCLDLIPAKYKVTQLSASGYSTLYKEGEGFDVIDLSEGVSDSTYVYRNDAQLCYQTHANAIYNKVYHIPATVTYQQLQYGTIAVDYLGEKDIRDKNLMGETKTMTLAEVPKGTHQVHYVFGHPIFKAGKDYTLEVSAHEDYYYNNASNGHLDQVMLEGGELIIRNGMVSGVSELKLALKHDGTQQFTFRPDNVVFALTDSAALRSINVAVELNDYYYEAGALKGFVIGNRELGTDVRTVSTHAGIDVVDVLRDPPGSGSFAYRDAGTSYSWSRNYQYDYTSALNISGSFGPNFEWENGVDFLGVVTTTKTKFSVSANFEINIPLESTHKNQKGSYTMTLNERISTSSDPFDNGANSDVYIGAIKTCEVSKCESFCVIDSVTYKCVKGAIGRGAVRLISQGTDISGAPYYLVTGQKLTYGTDYTRTFAYSQKHITGIIIPQLRREYQSLLVKGDSATLQKLANQTGQAYYLDEDSTYTWIKPKTSTYTGIDRVGECLNTIKSWWSVIGDNEEAKIAAMRNSTPYKRYSLGSTSLSYSESASAYYSAASWKGNTKVSGSGGFGVDFSRGKETKNEKEQNKTTTVDNPNFDPNQEEGENNQRTLQKQGNEKSTQGRFLGGHFTFSLNGGGTPSETDVTSYLKTHNAGYGFTLATNDNGYMDVDVYGSAVTDTENFTKAQLAWIKAGNTSDQSAGNLHSFIFVPRGGAMRNPWLAPDSTLNLVDNATQKPLPLGDRLLRIDNPKLKIDKSVVSNIPQDEKATFVLRVTNDTEISDQSTNLTPSTFTLTVDDSSNPDGAKIYLDGLPLAGSKSLRLPLGATYTKTIEVERGASAYDYNNIRLKLADQTNSLTDFASISIHYLPVATPVKITSPVNGWVMNTLSPQQDSLYYIPVQISGFDVNSEGFHHIEFQYKKQTDGEDQWVNLCSYFADDSLYQLATGQKRMIQGGSISDLRFFGETDPIEMKYDLRAVSFRSLGTGFVTRSSEVVSGLKDTSQPRIFGMPKPASGILTYADVISLPFNEPIAYNYLDKTSNFQVMGYTNDNRNALLTNSLHFDGSGKQTAITDVNRNLSDRNFAIEALIQPATDSLQTIVSQKDGEGNILDFFAYDNQLYLYLYSDKYLVWYESPRLPEKLSAAPHQVGVNFNAEKAGVEFLYDGTTLAGSKNYIGAEPKDFKYRGNGPLMVGGCQYKQEENVYCGTIYEARVWSREVDSDMRNAYTKKMLTGRERGLMCYWPMIEGAGNVVSDKVGGADLNLTGVTWNTSEGYSLNLNQRTTTLDKPAFVEQSAESDYTVDLWFHIDHVRGTATLLQNGSDSLRLGGRGLKLQVKDQKVLLSSRDTTFSFTTRVADKTWHRATLSVSHSTNVARFYIDANLALQESAARFGGLAGSSLTLGDTTMTCHIDNLCLWELALPESYIKEYHHQCPSGSEMGLKLFIPFQTYQRNDQNDLVIAFSDRNKSDYTSADGLHKCGLVTASSQADKTLRAPLMDGDRLSNLSFDWTSTNNELQINLQEVLSDINHQNVMLTVRGVEDLAGNSMVSPQMWTVYVDKNVLTWDQQQVSMTADYGKPYRIDVGWTNHGGKPVNYTISTDSKWLTLSQEMGQADSQEASEVQLTISDALAPGTYNTTVYLTDQDNLVSTLDVNVTVEAEAPDWSLDDSKYELNMTVMAQVYQMRSDSSLYINTSKNDLVAAFIDSRLVGVGHITTSKTLSYLYLNVFGNAADTTKVVTFYLWDSNNGKVRLLEADRPVRFLPGSTVGTPPATPLRLLCSDRAIQILTLDKGWNWVSFSVDPDGKTDANSLFLSNSPFTNLDIIKDDAHHIEYSSRTGKWTSGLSFAPGKIYRIYTAKAGTAQIPGATLKAQQQTIPLHGGWNEFPYMLEIAQPIESAMSDYQIGDKAHSGDILKSLDQFAVLYEDFGWLGSLETLRPGQGYYLHRTATDTCHVVLREHLLEGEEEPLQTSCFIKRRIQSTPIIAAFADSLTRPAEGRVLAYIGDDCVGEAHPVTLPDGQLRYFLMANANPGETIHLVVEETLEDATGSARTNRYDAGRIITGTATSIGTLEAPYLLQMGTAAPASVSPTAYDLGGRPYQDVPAGKVFIRQGKKAVQSFTK